MRQRPPGMIEYNPFLSDARDVISTYDPAHDFNLDEEDLLKERIQQILAHYPDKDTVNKDNKQDGNNNDNSN